MFYEKFYFTFNHILFQFTQPAIPSQTTTTCNLCKVDTSVDTGFSGSFVTSTESNSQPGSIFTTITPSTLKTGSNVVLSYETTIFFSRIKILFPGYTTTFVTEVYIPLSTVVVAKEVTALFFLFLLLLLLLVIHQSF
ncbi:hypothetical protein Glove_199g36 [Diversispora epigaea]|uniref:Uncharacterized protein n=1 Tax=Diversispora epigaea TaxID=1348612 RepID=A0A397IJZ6_9GLOM|nr:hypothetical protein Glove_199g36 [Diversispora epigaea]